MEIAQKEKSIILLKTRLEREKRMSFNQFYASHSSSHFDLDFEITQGMQNRKEPEE